ncbi:4'-phosphopantetheine phosphatase [Plecturocebus cupreus]
MSWPGTFKMAECRASGSGSSGDSLDKSITLPPDEIFRNLENAKRFAIDIGGSLTKLAYYSTVQHKVAKVRSFDHSGKDTERDHEPPYEISVQEEITARLHFIKFENTYIEACLDFIKDHLVNTETKVIQATGGGAYKFKDLIEEKLQLKVDKEDVMTCLIKGCNFVLKNIPQEAFVYQKDSDPEFRFQTNHPHIFPYLLVNIGSGVSIVKVETEDRFEWVGGSSIGGGTFWGLGALLTKTKKFDELLHLASRGQHSNVDMLVRDVYGGAHQTLGLSGNLIASSFGKLATADQEFSKEDIAKSLLHMISNDIGQLACLHARRHRLDRVYFGGFFIRGHPVTMRTITYSINFFSKGEVQALFLRHEGYLGAIGAFLKGAEQDNPNQYSWGENYAGSSGLMSTSPELGPAQRARSGTFDLLEMDRLERPLVNLPLLLDPPSYVPDTVDLTDDALARKYWLTCFEEALDGVVKRAVASQPDSVDAAERAEKFRQKYWNKLQTLRQQPFAYGTLTVRSLLDTREHCLNEFNFPDPYSKVKQRENGVALRCFPGVVRSLDALGWEERQLALVKGLLAGNVFDWGAKAVSDVLESDPHFGFEEAKRKLQERPWLVDSYSKWLQRLKGPPHKCALIFADNSGIDIILGVFPFVRELLLRGTEVILACNSGPALNDVTHSESLIVAERIAGMDPVVHSALREERLLLVQTGSSSPCLDLSRLDKGLAALVRERGADLVVIEGMGRAVHTNYHAALRCESLKLAVVKNAWLAERLGGRLFSVIFKYEGDCVRINVFILYCCDLAHAPGLRGARGHEARHSFVLGDVRVGVYLTAKDLLYIYIYINRELYTAGAPPDPPMGKPRARPFLWLLLDLMGREHRPPR